MNGVASALKQDDPRRKVLDHLALAHTRAGLGYVFSGHYEGEHWLATFAIYLRTEVGVAKCRDMNGTRLCQSLTAHTVPDSYTRPMCVYPDSSLVVAG